MAASYVRIAANLCNPATVSDLGCGDGGLLSLIQDDVHQAWGYDFQPSNAVAWPERGVDGALLDVFGADAGRVKLGTISAVTEVLEHLTDPHAAVRWIAGTSKFVVASSPWDEGPDDHDECHAWAWDQAGYRRLIEQGGYRILHHGQSSRFQLILGMRT